MSTGDFDLNLLRLAAAIDSERTVSAAARRLGISQPAASSALARLRRSLGDPLFVQGPHGMDPTPRAVRLIAAARDVLERVDREVLAADTFNPATATGTFTFALSDIGEMVFLPRLVKYLGEHAPHATVRSVSCPPAALEAALADGEVDLAVGYFPDLRKNVFFQQRLMTHHFVCLLRRDHPIRDPQLSLQQFLSLRHAVVSAEGRSQEIFERFLAEKRIERQIVLRTPHFMTIPMIVAQSDLVVTVPHALAIYFAAAGADVRAVLPPFEIPRIELRQHWHQRHHKDPKVAWLREAVASLFNDRVDEWQR